MDMPELETMTLTMRVSSCSLSFVRSEKRTQPSHESQQQPATEGEGMQGDRRSACHRQHKQG